MNTTILERPKIAVAKKSAATYVKGRRAFFKYRDLGVTAATQGKVRAQVTSAKIRHVETDRLAHPPV